MTKTRIVALLGVLALLAAMPLATVLAQQPVPPHRFYGMVVVDGEAPPVGTMVTASVMVMTEGEDGEMMEETKKIGETMTTDAMGNFVLDTEGDSMYAGKEIMFMIMVEGQEAMDAMPSTMMDDGEMMEMEPVMYMGGARDEVNLEVGESMVRPDGSRGPAPIVGPRGPAGPRGEAGEPGPAGEQGPAGPAGPRGPAGADGHDGHDGADGAAGARGPAGPAGADGADGADGAAGAQGPTGPAGPAGDQGPAGPAGNDGAPGATGPAGAAGGGGALAIVALIIAIVGVVAAGGAFIAGRRG